MKRRRTHRETAARFVCPFEGCGKSFVRREHLARHHLNHEPKEIYQCPQCPKQFIRPDLFARHQERHKKGMHFRRSGGLVSGHNDTPTARSSSMSPTLSCLPQNASVSNKSEYTTAEHPLFPSNGTSNETYSDASNHRSSHSSHVKSSPSPLSTVQKVPFPAPSPSSAPRTTNSNIRVEYGESAAPSDEFFSDLSTYRYPKPPPGQPSQSTKHTPDFIHPMTSSQTDSSQFQTIRTPSNMNTFLPTTSLLPVFGDPYYSSPSASFDELDWFFNQDLIDTSGIADHSINASVSSEQSQVPASHTHLPHSGVMTSSVHPDVGSVVEPMNSQKDAPQFGANAIQNTLSNLPTSIKWTFPYESAPISSYNVNSLTSAKQDPASSYKLPESWADSWETARPRLLQALGIGDMEGDSFFSSYNLRRFTQIYFDNYHSHFPFLHRPSCDPAYMPPLLFAAVVTLGATLAAEEAYWLTAVRIHDRLRWLIFSDPEFLPSPLWVLQALMLSQAFEKMFSTTRQHEISHIFHGAIITLMRRGRLYTTPSGTNTNGSRSTVEQQWYRWTEAEGTKRTAFFAFIMDAQHSALFGHHPSLTANEIRLQLPCDENLWEMEDPNQWAIAYENASELPSFVSTLKALLNQHPIPVAYSSFTRLTLLHGLCNVSWQVDQRDAASLGVTTRTSATQNGRVSTPSSEQGMQYPSSYVSGTSSPRPSGAHEYWNQTIVKAIDVWSNSTTVSDLSLAQEASNPLCHMTYITVYTKVNDFHVFAGAPSLLGRPMGRGDFNSAEAAVRSWAVSRGVRLAMFHSLLIIQDTLFKVQPGGRLYSATEDNIALRPWCLYLATLVVWAYGYVMEGPADIEPSRVMPPLNVRYSSSQQFLDRMLHTFGKNDTNIPPLGTNGTYEVVSIVRDSIANARWELLRDARTTLGRLIGQFD